MTFYFKICMEHMNPLWEKCWDFGVESSGLHIETTRFLVANESYYITFSYVRQNSGNETRGHNPTMLLLITLYK
jgi:hypothetical protein